MKQIMVTLAALLILATVARTNALASDEKELETVSFVDLNKYLGKWYEIASYYQSFQKDCVATTATYSLDEDGDIDVINECRLKTLDGKLKKADGYAKVVDKKTNAKLKVTFFWPFFGKYWIIDLGRNYEYAVVGHPNRKYLWILSRTPKMDKAVYDGILDRLKEKSFDLTKLNLTLQP